MVLSMTGYGQNEKQQDGTSLSVEIKGYNNRYLDVQLSMPSTFGAFENDMRNLIKENIGRGRVEVYIRVQSGAEAAEVSIDEVQAEALVNAFKGLKKRLGIGGQIKLEHLLSFDGLVRVDKRRDPEAIRPLVFEVFESALSAFGESRCREGESTAADILSQLERFEAAFADIRSREKDIEDRIQSQIRGKFQEVLGTRVDEDRVLSELAALLVKHSINEEISRLNAHIERFRAEMQEGGSLGKRLDFLCQEMNRETNTIGSKNIVQEIAMSVVEMKDSLENIREQLRNIE